MRFFFPKYYFLYKTKIKTLCFQHKYLLSKNQIKKINFKNFFANFKPKYFPNKLNWQKKFFYHIVYKPALSQKKSLKNFFASTKHDLFDYQK